MAARHASLVKNYVCYWAEAEWPGLVGCDRPLLAFEDFAVSQIAASYRHY